MVKIKKKLYLIWVLILVTLVTNVTAVVDVQISEDNSSWENVGTYFGGSISETDKVAIAEYLGQEKVYYIRAKNDTTDWNYLTFKTKGEFKMLAIVAGLFITMVAFGYLGFSSKGFAIKVFGYGIALIEMINVVYLLYINELGLSLSGILRINFWTLLILGFGIGMISLIVLSMKLINTSDDKPLGGIKWGGEKW